MSTSRCATLEAVCRRRLTARCSHHSSRPKRTASGSDSRLRRQSSRRIVAPSMPATIPKGAPHSPLRCAAAEHRDPVRPRECRVTVAQATPRAHSRRPPWSGESHLPDAGTGLRHRGKRRRRPRRAGRRATTPTGRGCGRPQPASRPRLGGMSSDQARQPRRRVVVFSAMNDPDIRQRSLEVGASAFVCKGTGDLLSTVKRLCDGRG